MANNLIDPTWVFGKKNQNCDTACLKITKNLKCNPSKQSTLTTENDVKMTMAKYGYQNGCKKVVLLDTPGTPFGHDGNCYYMQQSLCNDDGHYLNDYPGLRPLCYCGNYICKKESVN